MKIIKNKQIITKTDVITVLNSILNEKNKNIISKWIEIILSMDDKIFQQKLEKNNIETIEQIKSFFKPRISKIMSTSDKSKQEDRYLSTASWRKSNPTYETKQFLLALLIKEKINSHKKDGLYNIVLSHRPEYFRAYVEAGADLVFCGHAHGGQLIIGDKGLFAPGQGFFPEYTQGIHIKNYTSMIVSRGLGDSVLPRVNNMPELVIVTLRSK